METLRVQTFGPNPPDVEAWERCVASAKSKHIEQTTAWAEARALDGWKPSYLHAYCGHILVGGALILVRRVNRFVRVGYVSRGPVTSSGGNVDECDLAKTLTVELMRFARRRRLSVLVVDPPYLAGLLPEAMRAAGFTPHVQQLPPTGLMKGTLLIDLRVTEDQLLRGVRRSTRQVLRKADQNPLVRIRQGGREDLEVLWKLMNDLCRRRGVQPNVSSPAVMRVLWDRLAQTSSARIDVLEYDSEPITAVMTVCVGEWAMPWRIGWSGAEARLSPEKVLYWNLLRRLKAEGYTTFDFNWIDPSEAEAIRGGGEPDSSAHAGITAFKIGFGGEILKIVSPLDYFPNSLIRCGMRMGFGRLAKFAFMQRLFNRANRVS